MADKVLARPVYLGGDLLPAGTKLTAEQADKIKNPKAFEAEPTLDDKVKAAQEEYERLLQQAENEANAKGADAKGIGDIKDDRAENGAALARANKATAAKAPAAGKTGAES